MAEKKASLLIVLKDQASKGINKIGQGFKWLKSHALAVGAAIVAIGASIIKTLSAYAKQEKAEKMLGAALKAHGDNVTALLPKYKLLAREIQNQTTMGDEAALSLMAQIRNLGVMPSKMEQATKGAIGLATALNLDSNAAARYTALALQGEYTVLQRYVPALRTATSEAEKQKIVTDLMSKGYEQAQAESDTLSGITAQMKNAFGDLLETLGSFLAEPARDFIEWLKNAIQYLQENRATIGRVINTVVYFGQIVAQVFDFVLDTVRTSAEFFKGFGEAFVLLFQGNFAEAVEAFKTTFADGMTSAKDNFSDLVQDIGAAHGDLIKRNKKLVQEDKKTKAQLNAERTKYKAGLKKEQAIEDKEDATRKTARLKNEKAFRKGMLAVENNYYETRKKNFADTLNFISSLSTSHNKTLASIGKAAAIHQAIRHTYAAANRALASAPPPFNYGLAAAVIAAGLANVAKIKGTPLAEGGVVLPRTGGTLANIAEAGKPEAVIPLGDERAREELAELGGLTVNINAGVVVADKTSVREFAEMIDEELFALRQNKETVAF